MYYQIHYANCRDKKHRREKYLRQRVVNSMFSNILIRRYIDENKNM